jgi:hypothetical protein
MRDIFELDSILRKKQNLLSSKLELEKRKRKPLILGNTFWFETNLEKKFQNGQISNQG